MSWTTSFALQPDLQFKFWLAAELHMTVRQLSEMDCVEFHWWACHFQRKAAEEAKAMERAKRRRGNY